MPVANTTTKKENFSSSSFSSLFPFFSFFFYKFENNVSVHQIKKFSTPYSSSCIHLGSCFKNGKWKWKMKNKRKNIIYIFIIYKTVTRVNNTTTTTTENPLNPLNFHKLFSNFYYFLFLPSWFLSLYFFFRFFFIILTDL